jgi:tetratricopeptide (TPR) repeat protein
MVTIPEALAIATQHHQAGRLQAAEQIYRQILQAEPSHADAWHLLGLAASQQGRYEVAIECIGRAIGCDGAQAAFHSNLAGVYRALHRIPEAVACLRRALVLKPDDAGANYNLGLALKDQGKADEAVACLRRALELAPDVAKVHNNLGNLLKDLGNLDEAVACYRRAIELKPDFAETHNNLGNACKDQEKLDEALACYRRALELKPDLAETHNNLGSALKDLGKPDEALACYRRALELKPDFAGAHNNLGIALEEIGDFQGAEDSFRAALRHNPRFTRAHFELAALLGGNLPDADLAAARRLLEEGELTGAQRLPLHFGLAQVLDAWGEYAEAARHLDQGHALQSSERHKCGPKYDPKAYERFVTQMIEVSTPDFFHQVRGFGLETEVPVFVVGLPRSGTTLVEQILASHGQVFGAGELKLVRDTVAALGPEDAAVIGGLHHLDRPTARRLASRHLERLRALSPAAIRIVDKMPDNYLYLGLLATLFPRAKLIHCRRDVRDVAVSCWVTHFKEIPWANDQEHIASRFQQYQRIMDHWQKVLPAPLLEVDYEETVADLEGVARKLVAWCGLAWEPACQEFQKAKRPVRTASAVQVRQPIFRTSVGRWKHYEHALASLFARLEGRMLVTGPVDGRSRSRR